MKKLVLSLLMSSVIISSAHAGYKARITAATSVLKRYQTAITGTAGSLSTCYGVYLLRSGCIATATDTKNSPMSALAHLANPAFHQKLGTFFSLVGMGVSLFEIIRLARETNKQKNALIDQQ